MRPNLRVRLKALAAGECGVVDVAVPDELLAEAVELTFAYSDRLVLVSQSSRAAGLEPFIDLVDEHGRDRTALFVDYLQKVNAGATDPPDEDEVRRVARPRGLAIETGIAVVAIAAADRAGLTCRRLHAPPPGFDGDLLRGRRRRRPQREAHDVSDRTWPSTRPATRTSGSTDLQCEKNRSGRAGLDLEFKRTSASSGSGHRGDFVSERLWQEGGVED